MPTKSALVGMLAAAMGLEKGSEREVQWLPRLASLRLLVIQMPSPHQGRLRDYHTVQNVRKASGGIKETELTEREYHTDARFLALLEGEANVVGTAAEAMADPVFGVWLGRKACVPSAPVFVSVFDSEDEALPKLLEGKPLETFTHEREVTELKAGTDTRPDQPISFGEPGLARKPRQMAPRRIHRHVRTEE